MSCAIYSLRCRRPPSIDWVLRASAQIHRISCSIKYVKYAHKKIIMQTILAIFWRLMSRVECDMSSFEQCFLCKSGFIRAKDKYLIQGRSKENLPFELNSLPFSLTFHSTDYLCRSCVNTLKERRSLIEQLKQIEERFKSFHQSTKVTSPNTGLKRSLQDENVTSGRTLLKARATNKLAKWL